MAVSSTNKKIIVVRFERETLAGVANPATFGVDGTIEVLTLTGTLLTIPLEEVKAVCFVKDLPAPDAWKPNRFFAVRPKSEGLWLRFRFKDLDAMDGVIQNNLLLLEPQGYSVVPPDPSFLNQRIFIPRVALLEAQVMGVIGSPLRLPRKQKAVPPEQIELFGE
jgi:hypothetical protein